MPPKKARWNSRVAHDPAILWLALGALLLALEAFGLPGIGLLFAGLAAIIVGVAVQYEGIAIDDYVLQGAVFFLLTGVFGALLWKRMKQWRMNPKAGEYNNMVGDIAVVAAGGLTKAQRGHAIWSGTRMKAEIADHEPTERFAEGTELRIAAVEGIVLKLRAP
jgi:membrane protein implicated in regulation of membrane protease activity